MRTTCQAVETVVREALADATARMLLRSAGAEDHGEILWATFSDDGGETRIVFRAHRDEVAQVLRVIPGKDFQAGLTSARSAGQRKVFWGLRDE